MTVLALHATGVLADFHAAGVLALADVHTARRIARTRSGLAASPISRPWVSYIRKPATPISSRPNRIDAHPSRTGRSRSSASASFRFRAQGLCAPAITLSMLPSALMYQSVPSV